MEEQESQGAIKTEHPGYLLVQDTYLSGQGVGRIY